MAVGRWPKLPRCHPAALNPDPLRCRTMRHGADRPNFNNAVCRPDGGAHAGPTALAAAGETAALLAETQRLLRAQVESTRLTQEGHQYRARAAGVLVLFLLLLLQFSLHAVWLQRSAQLPILVSVVGIWGVSHWYLARFPVATELGAVKEGLCGVGSALRALRGV